MSELSPAVAAFLARLRTVKEYADEQTISVVQAHRRLKEGKAEGQLIRKRLFVVLPGADGQG